MTLSDRICARQSNAATLHRVLGAETQLYIKALKKRSNATGIAYRKRWWNKTERLRAQRSAQAREQLFELIG